MALTDKQRRFVDEYLIDLNATQAAIRAGYSEKTARAIACENLTKPDIEAAIAEAMKERQTRTHIDQDRVLQELARIAFFDARKLFTPDGYPLEITALGDDEAAAIAGIDIVVERTDEGGRDAFSSVRKYKIADKLSALQAAMRHLGMFKDKVELTGKDGGPVQHQNVPPDLSNLSDDELANLEAIAAKLGGNPGP